MYPVCKCLIKDYANLLRDQYRDDKSFRDFVSHKTQFQPSKSDLPL